MDNDNLILVLTNLPSRDMARKLASQIVAEKLAACVNISADILSIYNWDDEQQADTEVQLMIKTRQACYARLEALILGQHPYDLPEIIAIPLVAGLPAYLDWVRKETETL
ncbi:divalent-cation tolerance protein CutA [Undibacterium sp.]|uniref:divalent-cation tolerance protein CutA n=1 Tax=Undibacterium sp. TaxID=1914977 RepID=UPI002730A8BB|nr:divalent-cation tolerance protein CutA [Undibacterium sp.]MDP1977761.1 divalent-cation tolerance protein CutA [Undibacterium sp.]